MKKKILSLVLALGLTVGICTNAYAVKVRGDTIAPDPVTGEWVTKKIEIQNAQGEWEWVDVYNAEGVAQWVQICNTEGDLEWVQPQYAPSDETVRQQLNDKKAELEQQFGIRIVDKRAEESSLAMQLYRLFRIEEVIHVIPTPLYTAAQHKLAEQGKTLTISLPESDLSGGRMGYYTPQDTTIHLYAIDNNATFAHEYGHFLQLTLLDKAYGVGTLRAEWTSFNNGVAYGGEYDSQIFLSDYGATQYEEDFAVSFEYLLTNRSVVQDLAMAYPNCPAIRKLEFLQQLLCDTFSLNDSIFPSIHPSKPSSWAIEGIEEYAELFPNGNLASVTRPLYAGYQSGTTRKDFAVGAYDVVNAVWCNRLNDEFGMDHWIEMYPQYTYDKLEGLNPFLDLTYDGITSNEPIIKLYLMGMLSGTGPTTFNPNGQITRQEAAVMLHRVCTKLGYEFPEETEGTFNDSDQFADWAKDSIRAVSSVGIMSGVGNNQFDPQGIYTYEQSALTMVRVYELLT